MRAAMIVQDYHYPLYEVEQRRDFRNMLDNTCERFGDQTTLFEKIGEQPYQGISFNRFRELVQRRDVRFWKRSTDPGEVCSIVFTSGTTGVPKGMMLSQKNIIDNIVQMRRLCSSPEAPSQNRKSHGFSGSWAFGCCRGTVSPSALLSWRAIGTIFSVTGRRGSPPLDATSGYSIPTKRESARSGCRAPT